MGDTNLKSIMSDHKGFSKTHDIGSSIFLVAKSSVNQHVKDYYSHCYGIRVIDGVSIPDFFEELNEQIPKVERIIERSIKSIKKVVHEGRSFKSSFLKLEDSFSRIISSLSAEGLSLGNDRVVEVLGDIIEAKRELTTENSAWPQYVHLADWLIYLGTIFEIKGTSIEGIYLDAVYRSMDTMSKRQIYGLSWQAYKSWLNKWPSIISSNRALIKKHIEDRTFDTDPLAVVNSI